MVADAEFVQTTDLRRELSDGMAGAFRSPGFDAAVAQDSGAGADGGITVLAAGRDFVASGDGVCGFIAPAN